MSTRVEGWMALGGIMLGGLACRSETSPSLEDYRDRSPPPVAQTRTWTWSAPAVSISNARVPPPRTLEPAADGFARIDELGIEVQLPGPSALRPLLNRFELRVGTCDVTLNPVADPTRATVVGRFPIQCVLSPHCESGCPALRAMTGLSTEDMYPSEAPAVMAGVRGGMSGVGAGAVKIWRDGTVHFTGPRCEPWKIVRGKLDPTKVTNLLATLERIDFAAESSDCESAADAFYDYVTLTSRDGRSRSASQMSYCRSRLEAFTLVQDAVGPNPCNRR